MRVTRTSVVPPFLVRYSTGFLRCEGLPQPLRPALSVGMMAACSTQTFINPQPRIMASKTACIRAFWWKD